MWKRNGLSLVLLALTVVFIVGQAVAGHHVHNQTLTQHGRAPVDLWHYLATGHFVSATFENWESEFLQMGMYVLLTVSLRQRGSAESRPLDPRRSRTTSSRALRRGRFVAVAHGRRYTATRLRSPSACCSCSVLHCMHWVAGAPSRSSSSCRDCRCRVSWSIWAAARSGSNRCRTGRANSLPCCPWSCSRSSCGRKTHRNPSRSKLRTRRQVIEPWEMLRQRPC